MKVYYYGQGRRDVEGNLVWCYIYVCINRQEDIEFRGRTEWEFPFGVNCKRSALTCINIKISDWRVTTWFSNWIQEFILFYIFSTQMIFFFFLLDKASVYFKTIVNVPSFHIKFLDTSDNNWLTISYLFDCYVYRNCLLKYTIFRFMDNHISGDFFFFFAGLRLFKLQLGLLFNRLGCVSTLSFYADLVQNQAACCSDAACYRANLHRLQPESLHSQHSDDVQLFSLNLNDKKPTNWVTLHLLNKYTLAW